VPLHCSSALAYELVQCGAAGRAVLKLKMPWRDGVGALGDVAAGVHAAVGNAGVNGGFAAAILSL
jgi:hypothetical protein